MAEKWWSCHRCQMSGAAELVPRGGWCGNCGYEMVPESLGARHPVTQVRRHPDWNEAEREASFQRAWANRRGA